MIFFSLVIISILGIGSVLVVMINEGITIRVFGRWLRREELDEYLTENLERYTLNEMDYSRDLLYLRSMPYLSKVPMPILTVWYIAGRGVIPRWSPWTKKIQQKRDELVDLVDNHRAVKVMVADSSVRTSGFTLIELLVVIAIIGILSSMVLAASNKKHRERIKENTPVQTDSQPCAQGHS